MSNWFAEPVEGEVSKEEIEEKAANGEFHEWNFQAFDFVEYGYDDVMNRLKSYTAEEYNGYQQKRDAAKEAGNTAEVEKWQAEMNRMIDEVYAIYREKNIYPTAYYSEMGIIQEIEKCIAYKAFWDGNTVSCGAGVGTTLCKFLFPNLQDTPSKHDLDKEGAESIFAKFNNEKYLKRAIQFCFSYKNGCPVPVSVEGGLRLVGSAPSNFRPMNAKAIYERFCPEGGLIYDPCCVRGNTEFFTGTGWKRIDKYEEGDKVLQYNADGTATLVDPLEYISYTSKAPFYEYKSSNLDSCLTGNHDIVYLNGSVPCKRKQDEILEKSFNDPIPLTFRYNGDSYVSSESVELAMLVYFWGKEKDGKFIIPNVAKGFCSKIVSTILNNIDTSDISINNNTENDWDITFYWSKADWSKILFLSLDGKLGFSESFISNLFSMKDYCQEYVVSAVEKWGYCKKGDSTCFYVPTECADAFQFVFSSQGICLVSTEASKDRVRFGIYNNLGFYDVPKNYSVISEENKYCFSVPSHMLVLRYNGKIFITGNCGFGGRMLGALSSKKNFRYVGTDPNTETMYHLHQLGEYIEMVTGREDSYELHCCGSEDFKGKPNSVDFSFTSPPYFDLEVYSDEPTQCYNKFPNLEDWLEGYVRQTIKNIIYMLKPGRCYAINIADFNIGTGREVAYVDEWIRLSTEEGAPLFDTVYLGVTARAGSKEQAAGELKKENILIFKKPL